MAREFVRSKWFSAVQGTNATMDCGVRGLREAAALASQLATSNSRQLLKPDGRKVNQEVQQQLLHRSCHTLLVGYGHELRSDGHLRAELGKEAERPRGGNNDVPVNI